MRPSEKTMSKTKDRKTKIEQTLRQAEIVAVDKEESAKAWNRLCRELENMSAPEARPPRFAGLLRAIWTAATNEQS